MGIGKKLEVPLKEKSRNVNDISKATNISTSTIYSIIRRNNTKAGLDDLQTITDELGVTLEYFTDTPIMGRKKHLAKGKVDVSYKELFYLYFRSVGQMLSLIIHD